MAPRLFANLNEDERQDPFEMAVAIGLIALYCILIYIGVSIMRIALELLLRYLRIKFGSRQKPSPSKAIVITGATSGIGLAVTKVLYREGFTVIAAYYNKQEPGYDELHEIIDSKASKPTKAAKLFLVHMDVRSEQSIDAAAIEIEQLLGNHQLELHTVICNAGIVDCSLEINSMKNIRNIIATNFSGTTMVAKRFMSPIIKSEGRIAIVSSIACRWIAPTVPIYVATKAAVSSLADSINETLRLYGASCSCICPGNLSNMSNIMVTSAKYAQDAVSNLTADEKINYKDSIERNNSLLDKLIRLRLEQLSGGEKLTAASYVADAHSENTQLGWSNKLKVWMVTLMEGGFIGFGTKKKMELENTDAMDAFKDAVLMRNPPYRLYPGNKIFQHILGPLSGEHPPSPSVMRWILHILV